MLESFDGAHGHQMAQCCTPEEIVLWLPCQPGRIQKMSLYAHPGLSYIAEVHRRPRSLKPDASRVMYARRFTSWVRLGSQRRSFSVSRAWCVVQHWLALDFHALAPFDTAPHPPR